MDLSKHVVDAEWGLLTSIARAVSTPLSAMGGIQHHTTANDPSVQMFSACKTEPSPFSSPPWVILGVVLTRQANLGVECVCVEREGAKPCGASRSF